MENIKTADKNADYEKLYIDNRKIIENTNIWKFLENIENKKMLDITEIKIVSENSKYKRIKIYGENLFIFSDTLAELNKLVSEKYGIFLIDRNNISIVFELLNSEE